MFFHQMFLSGLISPQAVGTVAIACKLQKVGARGEDTLQVWKMNEDLI